MSPVPTAPAPLRILCLEDNPLIACLVEQMIEDSGCVFAGALASFEELQEAAGRLEMDAALIDIDLADGSTGPQAAAWLAARGIPAVFLTGQEHVAVEHRGVSVGLLSKPVTEQGMTRALDQLRKATEDSSTQS